MKTLLRALALALLAAWPAHALAAGITISSGSSVQAGPWYLYWPLDAQTKVPALGGTQFLPPQYGAMAPSFAPQMPVGPMPNPAFPPFPQMNPTGATSAWPQQPAAYRPVGYWPGYGGPWSYGR